MNRTPMEIEKLIETYNYDMHKAAQHDAMVAQAMKARAEARSQRSAKSGATAEKGIIPNWIAALRRAIRSTQTDKLSR